MTLLSIGEFARLSRLSAKALRRYGELGLLRPDRVDPGTGYRWYAARQLKQARLVAVLRQVGVPLARIEPMPGLPAAAVAGQVAAYWAEAESAPAARRDLAGYLVDRLNGKETIMYEVTSRDVPERRLLCLKRNVDESGAWALGQEFVGLLQSQPLPRVPGGARRRLHHLPRGGHPGQRRPGRVVPPRPGRPGGRPGRPVPRAHPAHRARPSGGVRPPFRRP